jgi:hypothetical protein
MHGLLLLLMLATVYQLTPWELRYEATLKKGTEEVVHFLAGSLHPKAPEIDLAIYRAARLGPAARPLWPRLVHISFFHLEQSGVAGPRVVRLPVVLPAKELRVAGREIVWAMATGQGKRGSVFRFLDLEFAPETVASVAFELPGEGMEGYAVLTKLEGAWRVVGIHVNEP